MELGYGPLVGFLIRELAAAGVVVEPAPAKEAPARVRASGKRAILELAVQHLGLRFLERCGRALADEVGHPFIRALRVAGELEPLFATWSRLEVLGHSENRARLNAIEGRYVALDRVRRSGGVPTLAEDTLVLGLLAGLIEHLGYRRVTIEQGTEDSTSRCWRIGWSSRGAASAIPLSSPWSSAPDYVRACFALLLHDPSTSLTALAHHMHLTPRTLRRRFDAAGTSFRSLARTARIARAGELLLYERTPPLTEVAHACGFSDAAHFSREFRALVGVPPSTLVDALSDSFKRGKRRRS